MIEVGRIGEIVRYPVKSMAGVAAESAELGWHGLEGDRRFAFRRVGNESDFPWLTAGKVPELVLYQPTGLDDCGGEPVPTHVRTPGGETLELRSAALAAEVTARFGGPLELMRLRHGIFDDGAVSVIQAATIAEIARHAGCALDRRRFRANIVVESSDGEAFTEDSWLGCTLVFGDAEYGPAVSVTMRDVRCAMLNIDPDTAERDGRVMSAAVRLNENRAGIYASVLRTGRIHVGDAVRLVG